jgi:DNA-binding Xre family transcriptional regulator
MKERLVEFLAYLGMGQTKFEEKVGLSRGFVNNIGENITSKTLKKITEIYPELNTNWLKTGEGKMLRSTSINDIKGNGNTSVAGNGNQITTANITEMLELQKGYQEMIKTSQSQLSESQSQINRLITIIEQSHHGI